MSPLNKIQLLKIRYVLFAFIFVTLLIFALLIRWEFVDSEKYLAIANERNKQTKIPSVRGSILANDGTTLAYSEPRFDAYIWMPTLQSYEDRQMQTREEFVKKVAPIIEADALELEKQLASGQSWIKVANKLTLEQRDKLLDLKSDKNEKIAIRGLQFQYVNKRIYPENNLASQLLGYVMLAEREDGYKGVWGLEQYWDGLLKPQEGYEATEFDSFGNYIAIGEDETIEPKPGATIYTTINKSVQSVLEENLKKAFEQFKPKSATGIIMNPKTGEIYAMANYPDFDPNNYSKQTDMSVFGNYAVSTPYEIGSVGKVFTLAAAIDLGKVDTNTVILPTGHDGCEIISPDPGPGASCRGPNKTGKIVDCICTAERTPIKHSLSIEDAVVLSDNIAFRHIALTMNYDEFYQYLVKFGVGKVTHIDTAGESYSVLKPSNTWNYADQAVFSYGHGYSITPIQAITGVAAVANEGQRMQPYMVSKVVDADNKVTVFKPKVIEQVVKPETCDKVMYLMNKAFLKQLREAKYKYLSKYYIGLKSGTALVPYKDRAGYSDKINTTFVGFDASPEKKFVMFIKLEEPEVGVLSWQNVRVVWLDTFIGIKDILKVQPYSP
jgi:cell division protein FtsI/penicillin-binding protein 2